MIRQTIEDEIKRVEAVEIFLLIHNFINIAYVILYMDCQSFKCSNLIFD